jgi:hypothetical protein
VDGTSEAVDLIVMATGYEISFPFFASGLVPIKSGVPQLYLNIFHPEYDNLFFTGLFDASTKTWELVERQAAVIGAYIQALDGTDASLDWLAELRQNPLAGRFRKPPTLQQYLYLEYFWYRQKLKVLGERIRKSSNVLSRETRWKETGRKKRWAKETGTGPV